MGEHYFSAQSDSPLKLRTIRARLAGRDVDVDTAGGVFSPDHVDLGTRVLLDRAELPPATGTLLDLGCGWGPIALSMAMHAPEASVWAVDVNERARELTARNAARLDCSNITVACPDAVPDAIRFDMIWSNPPIRVGKQVLHDMLRTWLPRLTPDGSATLVVQRNLGADSLQHWLSNDSGLAITVERVASAKGFRLLRALPRH